MCSVCACMSVGVSIGNHACVLYVLECGTHVHVHVHVLSMHVPVSMQVCSVCARERGCVCMKLHTHVSLFACVHGCGCVHESVFLPMCLCFICFHVGLHISFSLRALSRSLVHLCILSLGWHTVSPHVTHTHLSLLLQDTKLAVANIGCIFSFSHIFRSKCIF